jgi:predicted RNA-binding Zn-ribbon protein involved in translation (DUF1610 family)
MLRASPPHTPRVSWTTADGHLEAAMGLENDFARLIDRAPRVECARCAVEMRLRTLVPVVEKEEYRATYRCPNCGTDIQRTFPISSTTA